MAERGRRLAREDGLQVLVTLQPCALLGVPPQEHEQAFAQFASDLAQAKKLL